MKRKLQIMGVILLAYCIYMAFFDQNNWLQQRSRIQALNETNNKIEYLSQESDRMDAEIKGLQVEAATIEKNAREKFFYKKDNEDVYLIKTEVDSTLEINQTSSVK